MKIPDNATELYFDTGGCAGDAYEGHYYAGYWYLELRCKLSDGTSCRIWDSSWYDDDDFGMYPELRQDVTELFAELNLDINKIVDFQEDCVWDWEYNHNM